MNKVTIDADELARLRWDSHLLHDEVIPRLEAYLVHAEARDAALDAMDREASNVFEFPSR